MHGRPGQGQFDHPRLTGRWKCLRVTVSGLALSGFVACSDDTKALREWTPEDHTHPAASGTAVNGAGQQAGNLADTEQQSVAILWRARCAGCHGGDGTGVPREGKPDLQDLTVRTWQQGNSDAEIASVIRNGRGDMPAYGPDQPAERRLNELGIAALVGHIRRLAQQTQSAH